jgi:hypothetical protein
MDDAVSGRPNFLIVGVPKAGTTTLHYILIQHKQVCLPRDKEAHFFDNRWARLKGVRYYSNKHFGHWQGEPFVGDITPRYFNHRRYLRRIADILGRDTKIIVIFRFPVARSFSHYTHYVYLLDERLPFSSARGEVDSYYIQPSFYADRFAFMISLFGRDNILPLIFERDIAAEGSSVAYRKIAQFLGLPEQPGMELNQQRSKGFRPRIERAQDDGAVEDHRGSHRYRKGDIVIQSLVPDIGVPQFTITRSRLPWVNNRWMHQFDKATFSLLREEVQAIYQRYFREDVERMKELLGDKLPEWNPDTAGVSSPTQLPPLLC